MGLKEQVVLAVVVSKSVVVGALIVYCLLVKLPRSTKQKVAGLHRNNITSYLINISAYAEWYHHLLTNLQLSFII